MIPTEQGYGRGMFRGLLRYANTIGQWRPVVSTNPWPELVAEMEWVAGMVILPMSERVADAARKLPLPVVNLSVRLRDAQWPTVCVDDHAAGRVAGQHLVDRGHTRFIAFGDTRTETFRRRRDGFAEAVNAVGATITTMHSGGLAGGDGWTQLRLELVSLPKPTAIFAYDDVCGRLLAQCAADANVLVPEELAICAVNNDILMCESCSPPLSSVDGRFDEIGFQAGQLLDTLLDGSDPPAKPILVPPGDVAVRRSTALFAVQDRRLALALAFMHEHACDPTHVVDVVRKLHLNRRWLERTFLRQLHSTPHEYLNRLRLERARHLLRETRLTVPDIAERTGFGYEPNLRRAFLSLYGQTPAGYRRSLASPS